MPSPTFQAFDQAVSDLAKAIRYYDGLQSRLVQLVTHWRNLDHTQRVELGKQHPQLVNALLDIEARLT